jgi:hypothetical protein
MLCDFKPSLRNELTAIKNAANGVGRANVASVEIMWRGELQRRFFNAPSICQDFTDSSKATFVEYVNRTSQEKKILDMYIRTKVIYTELKHQKFLKDINVSKIFTRKNQNRATWITFTLCLLINLILILYYDGSDCFENYTYPFPDGVETIVTCGDPVLPTGARQAVDLLNVLQIVFSSFTLGLFLIVRAPVHYITHRNAGHGMATSAVMTAMDPFTLYYFVYVIFAAVSISVDHVLTLLLLDIVVKNSYALDVIIAVFTPIKQLAMACLLCVIVMYIFSTVLVSGEYCEAHMR